MPDVRTQNGEHASEVTGSLNYLDEYNIIDINDHQKYMHKNVKQPPIDHLSFGPLFVAILDFGP